MVIHRESSRESKNQMLEDTLRGRWRNVCWRDGGVGIEDSPGCLGSTDPREGLVQCQVLGPT